MNQESKKEYLKKILRKSEVTRNAHYLLFNRYRILSNVLHAIILIGSSIVAILTFAKFTTFKPIFQKISEEGYTLFVGLFASLIFILTVIEEFGKLSDKASGHENTAKQLTSFIRNTDAIKKLPEISEEDIDKVTMQYNMINENALSLTDKAFYKAKQRLFIKIEISKELEKNPFLFIWLFKICKRIEFYKKSKNQSSETLVDKEKRESGDDE
ncbi:hypothetical protein BAMA_19270 [Bacillus manliponensis]|uniref:SMODS and SLOG-associating 2TM effector domain-containing protein n=1 Tax=Bacillus manliponensis TaxID=574376 RepID=A0A073K0E1_9BACI|nr:SLATT domain-containing protein [Bacillus manliponensis]KEK19912.1 hypothetical protein BAMA_19270 [Bacillus manliponensis]